MSVRDLTGLLADSTLTWSERLTRLQGWRGPDAAAADRAQLAQRLGATVCAVGALAGVAAQSPVVLGLFASTALVGAVAPNHPVEAAYNWWATGRRRATLPSNRAAKRLGCAIGVMFLGGATLAYAAGAATLGAVLALILGATAAFVAVTGICVPSIVFTVLWGAERACAPSLASVASRQRAPAEPVP